MAFNGTLRKSCGSASHPAGKRPHGQTVRTLLLLSALTAFLFLALPAAPGNAAAGTLTLPGSLKTIEAEAFRMDTSISRVILPNKVETIGAYAFARSSLTWIHLPASLKQIAATAFSGCSSRLKAEVYEDSYAHHWCTENGITCDVIRITGQPAAAEADLGRSVTFSVSAEGSTFTYQWQCKRKNATRWTNCSGMTSAEMTFTPVKADNRAQYRCKITDAYGQELISSAATLVVRRHIAVLVGNGAYAGDNRLEGPPNDISTLYGALRGLGQG